LYKIFQTYFKDIVSNFAWFALSQMVLPLCKTVKFEWGEGEKKFEINDTCLEISAAHPFTIKLDDGEHIIADLNILGEELVSEHRLNFFLKPSQTLVIYDVNIEEIKSWICSNDIAVVKPGISKFFSKYNPVGFIWNMTWNDQLSYEHSKPNEEGNCLLFLSSSSQKGIQLSLERPSAGRFILNLLNSSHQKLKEGLLESDPNVFLFLVFKALFYHACDDFRNYHSDEFFIPFKDETLAEISKLINEDADFEDALIEVVNGNELQELNKILSSSPEEFDKLNLDTLSKSLKEIVGKLRKLAYQELQGTSAFVTECIKQVITYLDP
jgi:hypothetical protein